MRIAIRPITEFKSEQIPVLKAIFDAVQLALNGHISAANLEDEAVTEDKILDDAVTAAKIAHFVSGVRTGTGAEESIAHGLGETPATVLVSIYDTNNLATVSLVEGTHDVTNVKVTVSNTAKYKLVAIK